MPLWADQLLPQLLMQQFDTLPLQCRCIERMHEGIWFKKKMTKLQLRELRHFFPNIAFVYANIYQICTTAFDRTI